MLNTKTVEKLPNVSYGQWSEPEAEFQYRKFFGRCDNKYGVYPSGWSEDRYGRAPMLGVVYADDAFLAEKLAYDRGLAPSGAAVVKLLGSVRRTAE